jgi:hypothetical protein
LLSLRSPAAILRCRQRHRLLACRHSTAAMPCYHQRQRARTKRRRVNAPSSPGKNRPRAKGQGRASVSSLPFSAKRPAVLMRNCTMRVVATQAIWSWDGRCYLALKSAGAAMTPRRAATLTNRLSPVQITSAVPIQSAHARHNFAICAYVATFLGTKRSNRGMPGFRQRTVLAVMPLGAPPPSGAAQAAQDLPRRPGGAPAPG